MSILKDNYQDEELESFFDGSMPMGIGINCDLDKHLLFKRGQFNLILGNDNVGKTFFLIWYMCMLSIKSGLKWTMYCSENEVWSTKYKLMSFFSNQSIKDLDPKEYYMAKNWVEEHFKFVDTRKTYILKELIKVFEDSDTDGYLIDPYNSLSKERGIDSHTYEYEMANLIRMFCRNRNKTVYISMHPVTEASRNIHTKGDYTGQQAPPRKSHAEGGQKWANRCDDFIIVHRYFTDEMVTKSLVYVEKIKETETGGNRTMFNEPLVFQFASYGFSINGKNPLLREFVQPEISTFDPKEAFKDVKPIEEVEQMERLGDNGEIETVEKPF